MEIMHFMKPFCELVFVFEDDVLSTAIKIVNDFKFTTIPIVTRSGKFVGTLSEGDLLRFIVQHGEDKIDVYSVSGIDRYHDYKAISVKGNMRDLIVRASEENFVPVVDDQNKLIGIVTRKTLLNYFFEHNFIVL